MKPSATPRHPGTFVRESVIPAGMSVTDAAKRLGIGRPALSNFLNGKSALSPEMAVRLEKAFGADRKRLLDMQAAYDRQERRAGEKEVAVRAFVPNFLTIKARQIEDWADSQIDARTHLPVFLRKLVHSTGNDLRQVDFPGYDNAQRKGSDGFVEAGAATPWVPEGKSYWEFGTDQKPGVKAESDYTARLTSVDPAERASSTFVFVTPRNWPGKTAWEKRKNEAGDWKAVRAFDASDLEQWLEQSVPAQIWLAEQLALPVSGYETLEQAWRRWANASEPHLTPEIFAPSIAAYRGKFKEWLNKPSDRPFVVAADLRDEALAFLACLFDDEELRRIQRPRRGLHISGDAQDACCVLRAFHPDRPFRRRRARTRRRPSPAPLHRFPSPQRGRYGSRHCARPARLTTPSRRRSPPWGSRKATSTGLQGSRAVRRRSCAAASRRMPRSGRRHGPAMTTRQRPSCRWL